MSNVNYKISQYCRVLIYFTEDVFPSAQNGTKWIPRQEDNQGVITPSGGAERGGKTQRSKACEHFHINFTSKVK